MASIVTLIELRAYNAELWNYGIINVELWI